MYSISRVIACDLPDYGDTKTHIETKIIDITYL